MCVVMKMLVCLVVSLELGLQGCCVLHCAEASNLIKTSNGDLAQGSDEVYLEGLYRSAPAYYDDAEEVPHVCHLDLCYKMYS